MQHQPYFTRILFALCFVAILFAACSKDPDVPKPPVNNKWLLSKIYVEEQGEEKYLEQEYKYRYGERQPWLHIAYSPFNHADTFAIDTFLYDHQHRLLQVNSRLGTYSRQYPRKTIFYGPAGRIDSIRLMQGRFTSMIIYKHTDTAIIQSLLSSSRPWPVEEFLYTYTAGGNLAGISTGGSFGVRVFSYSRYDNRPNVLSYLNMNVYLPAHPPIKGVSSSSTLERVNIPLLSRNNYGLLEQEGDWLTVYVYDYTQDTGGLITEILETSPTMPYRKQLLEYIPVQ